MSTSTTIATKRATPSLAELFTPKLVTVLREGYGLAALRADAIAGLTVAIVALPLSMAIAIGSGLSPEKGLFTAVVGGFLISALGGSRFQIGGPAGAFIVLIASIVERAGYEGLVIATAMAGIIMIAAGYLRIGTYIKYIPFPVTVGFTTGIAVIIFASQVKDMLGLDIAHEPAALIPKIEAIASAIGSIRPSTVFMSLLSIGIILGIRRLRPNWPGMLIAVGVTAALTAFLHLDVATIGSRFGGVPRMLPAPAFPEITLAKIQAAVPDALSIALLGAIESLLSAVVADGMSGRKHRSNCELVAQGFANCAAVVFGGMCVTGTIARTATNVRAGAYGPVSGMLHSVFVLLFMLVAAPLAIYIPLAGLGGVLAVVAWNMAEKREFVSLIRSSRGDAAVLLATFLLTIFVELTIAIAVGVTLGAFLFLHRMAEAVEVETGSVLIADDQADSAEGDGTDMPRVTDEGVMVYRISGAFFFGATAAVGSVLDRIGAQPKAFVLDFSEVPFVDSTAAKSLEGFAKKLNRAGTTVYFTSTSKHVRRTLLNAGLRRPLVLYAAGIEDALAAARESAPTQAG
ncbi:Putative sulfate transporter with a STAS domain (C-terminal) [Hyphomicrobium sp. GJ21]|uniref:SulP family inorganic anion transporter n=1 Tax=Hyphomicrobium sp. GJ21 TaxID=113574 RepID=UPI000622BF54|nr:SulP family inorganic anion transporter [Hyphomicrobium sp. GJ21]CEJ88348.1 Putative sulfate transporter with a STAS domain (C-terminal) [Hyphomicrobium sp. GJ21]